ncbi:MAG: nicotinate (nicotinamide) nucleotide adenylyltransferase [Polyangiales bacterium]
MTRRRVAIYGGSFDPPHLGHVLSVAWALSAAHIDEVWAIPTWKHAFGKAHGAPFDARMAMCELGFAPFRDVRTMDIERELRDVSRTLHTLETIRSRRPDVELRLLIGGDVLQTVDRWYRWNDIVALAPPLVVGREGYPAPEGCPISIPNVSSTDVRAALDGAGDLDGLVPTAVIAYIREHDLYASSE